MKRMQEIRYRAIALVMILAVLFSAAVPAGEVKAAESTRVAISAQYDYGKAFSVLDEVNKQRRSAGRNALTMDVELLNAAMLRAHELSVLCQHVRPNGETCFTASRLMMGENIAAGYTTSSTVMKGWMSSQGHKENILQERFTSIGVGVTFVNGKYYWVQCFGTASSAAASKSSYTNRNVTREIAFDSSLVPAKLVCSPSSISAGKTAKALLSFNNGIRANTGVPKGFSFQSSNTKVCTVDANGIIKGVNGGTATIRLLSGSKTFSSARITVSSKKTSTAAKVTAPKKTSISKLRAGKKKITVKWKRQLTGKPGYQIQYSTNSKFKSGKKTVTVSKNKTTSKTITKLKAKKKYYVRIRTYKTVKGKKVYSAWSKAKSVKTK